MYNTYIFAYITYYYTFLNIYGIECILIRYIVTAVVTILYDVLIIQRGAVLQSVCIFIRFISKKTDVGRTGPRHVVERVYIRIPASCSERFI